VLEKGYQQLTTYGIAKDVSWRDWQQYMIQLINMGYVEIAFHDQNKLRLTSLAKNVLFKGEKVLLAEVIQAELRKEQAVAEKTSENTLFERLRKLRLELSKDEGIPAYLIFNDATLKEMEKERPMTDEDFMQISGVGRQKMQNYGYRFIKEIIAHSKEKREKKSRKKGNTYKETFNLYKEGMTIEEIAQTRNLAPTTIFSHLSKLYDSGENVDLKKFISKGDLEAVKKAKSKLENPDALKPYFEHFQEEMDYGTIRMALTILNKEG
jgi:ATP-dependent DNA helicase RecQ